MRLIQRSVNAGDYWTCLISGGGESEYSTRHSH